MAHPTELADLTSELRERVLISRFRFEWSSAKQGKHLLLCGDWNRCGRRSSRTIQGSDGEPIKKPKRSLSTGCRQLALDAAASLILAWEQGGDTRRRRRPNAEPTSSLLARQRRVMFEGIRNREGGHGVKQKHMRHARSLFQWLDDHNQLLDAPNAIHWAGVGTERNTDTYSDRLRIAQWACQWNSMRWVLPESKRAKKPIVCRPFVDHCSDNQIELAFDLIKDPEAEAFFRVVAATGCRPGEVMLFNWQKWVEDGRNRALHGYSPKGSKEFVAICNPLEWMKDLDTDLLPISDVETDRRPSEEEVKSLGVRNYSRLLKMVQRDLKAANWQYIPTWTDLRHLWSIRAIIDGYDLRTAAIAQAHSSRMAEMVYLRHGEKRQVLAEIERMARVTQVVS